MKNSKPFTTVMAERLEPRTSIPEVPGSSPGPAAKLFFPPQFRTPSTNSFAYSQSELHDMNMNDLRLRNKSTHARGGKEERVHARCIQPNLRANMATSDCHTNIVVYCALIQRPLSLILNNYAG